MPKSIKFTVIEFNTVGSHDTHTRVEIYPHDPLTKSKITTQLTPIFESCWRFEAAGIGFCKPGDLYDLETGCRMSLKSALRMIEDDSTKRLIWEKYLELYPVANRTATFKRRVVNSIVKRLGQLGNPFPDALIPIKE